MADRDKMDESLEAADARARIERARSYQIELFKSAKERNTIVCLGTGTGKTYISVLLLKHLEHEVSGCWVDGEPATPGSGGKRSIFLAPTVPLVEQQGAVLGRHLSVKVGIYVGAMQVDLWSRERWVNELKAHGVLVMTPAILYNAACHGFIPLNKISLIVMDECHRATGDDNYVSIMKLYKDLQPQDRPRVLGLTGSVINSALRGVQVTRRIRELEATLFSTASSASGLVSMYCTKPKEMIVSCPSRNPHNRLPIDASSMEDLEDCDDLKDFQKILSGLSSCYEECGAFCTLRLIEFRQRELSRNVGDSQYPEELREYLMPKMKILERMKKFLGKSPPLLDVPPKMHRLLEVLAAFRTNPAGLCGIVFVKLRVIAYVLYQWLGELSKTDDWRFLRCAFIVGHNQAPMSTSNREFENFKMNSKAQRRTIAAFRDGVYNLLLATNVIEEGMDVPACNLVVRFDAPRDARSYTQSKGRARARQSLYVVLCDENERLEVEDMIDSFQETERIVTTFCDQTRRSPDAEESETVLRDDEFLEPFIAGEARISAKSAMSILCWYCQTIVHDQYSNSLPEFFTLDKNDEGFTMSLTMPLLCPVRESITNEDRPMPTRAKAKAYLALEMCRKLHEKRELTEHLLPRKLTTGRYSSAWMSDEDRTILEEIRPKMTRCPDTRHKTRQYLNRRAIAPPLEILEENRDCGCIDECHLYVFKNSVFEKSSSRSTGAKSPADGPQGSTYLGILVRNRDEQLENLPRFPIFTESSEQLIDVVYAGTVSMSQSKKATFARFNRYIFSVVLNIGCSATKPLTNFAVPCVVPVDELGDEAFEINLRVAQSVGVATQPDYERFIFDKELYEDAVVEVLFHENENAPPVNRNVQGRGPRDYFNRYYVRNPCATDAAGKPLSLTASGYFPFAPDLNFLEYFGGKQMRCRPNVPTNEDQPILELESVESSLEMLFPSAESSDRGSKKAVRSLAYVPAQFVVVHKMKANLWRRAVCLPSILYRLNRFHVCETLRRTIARATGIGPANENHRWEPAQIRAERREFRRTEISLKHLKLEFVYPDLNDCEGPSAADFVRILSKPTTSVDELDIGRYRLVGESFLQMVIGFSLHDQRRNLHEKELRSLRSYKISTRNLLVRAYERNITEILDNVKFIAKENFLPPGYRTLEKEEKLLDTTFRLAVYRSYGFEIDGSLCLRELRHATNLEEVVKAIAELDPEELQHETLQTTLEAGELPSQVPVKKFQTYRARVAADAVKAITGLAVDKCGPSGALRVMRWLGLEFGRSIDSPDFVDAFALNLDSLRVSDSDAVILNRLHQIETVESRLRYRFEHKALVLEAITHHSYRGDSLTQSNVQLCSIGAVVIEYLISKFIASLPLDVESYNLFELRASICSAVNHAHIVAKNGLHKNLLYTNQSLFTVIRNYIDCLDDYEPQPSKSLGDWESDDTDDDRVPLALAEMLMALVGAVFIDSGKNLEIVWSVYAELCGEQILRLANNIPISPIRELFARFPGSYFEYSLSWDDVYEGDFIEVTLCVQYPGGTIARFSQLANSKAEGRISIAKKFLNKLETQEQQKNIEKNKIAEEYLQILEKALLEAESLKSRKFGPFGISRATAF
ncbi:endoribonuclease Dicer [Galendromus occidentalis]|uniref:Endoribonuclease Dicer n=1 Tax=Galendromus occidentalis TaxID=34638 RepID=A0AAJ7SEM5_9ACAR|nr:endoribonuclease Dicer [Galendromus occidentalis]